MRAHAGGRRSLRKKSGVAGNADDGAGASGRGDQWSFFIDLPVLEAATAVFSDRNLLGRGSPPGAAAEGPLPPHYIAVPWCVQ
jgi:hypothetical protein